MHINSHTKKLVTIISTSRLNVPSLSCYMKHSTSTITRKKKTPEQPPKRAYPIELFTLRYEPSLNRYFGTNTRPILFALCMTTHLQIGVKPTREVNVFQVTNHDQFMLGISLFTSKKFKKPTSEYSTYRSLAR